MSTHMFYLIFWVPILIGTVCIRYSVTTHSLPLLMNGKVISLHTHKTATCKTQHVLEKSGVHEMGQINQITGTILS